MNRRKFIYTAGATTGAAVLGGCASFSSRKNYTPEGTMPLRVLGKTGIKVSMLGYGSHLSKALIAKPDVRDKLIKTSYDCGVNTFDVYDHSGFKQFKPMGQSVKGFRKDAIISLCFVRELSKMEEEINGALQDFMTDYIDLYRLYDVNDERIALAEKFKKEGKIRAIGVVTHDEPTMQKHLDKYGDVLDYVMIVYNFHHNRGIPSGLDGFPENNFDALIPRVKKMNLGIIGIKPMGSDGMVEFAKKNGFFRNKKVNVAQAMLRHIFKLNELHTTMPSMNSMDELITDLRAAYFPDFSQEEKDILAKLSKMAAETKRAYLPDHYKWLEDWTTNKFDTV